MDDSDQDFVDICSSKLRNCVRKKAGEPTRQTKKAEQQQALSQAVQGDRRRKNKQGDDSGSKFAATQPAGAEAERDVVCGGTTSDSGASSALPSDHRAQTERDLSTKDKVLLKMQHFKRASPQKMVHNINIQPTRQDICTLTAQHQIQESDEALALHLQQQLDREAAEVQTVDLEDGGLFFCQICHRDLSHMTPEGRTQHLNRCLDESEESGPAPPPASAVPDCPICGKKFKSQKSRLSHLKRCSADMGVSPAELLQVLQRQAQETQSAATANTLFQSGVKKRKGPPKSGVPARKKPRNKAEPLDEETMVALALSCSMVEQEKEEEAGKHLQTECVPSHSSMNPVLRWRPDAAKGRGKQKKGVVPPPPPLLLIQDATTTLARLQERVSALLLRSRAPSPPTPTRCPSSLPNWTGAALLWQKSALLDEDSSCLPDFYAAELKQFFPALESVKTDAAPSTISSKPERFDQPVSEGNPVSGPKASVPPSCSQTASCSSASSTPGAWQLSVGSQALRDLMELAEDGMTLTQYGYTSKETHPSDIIQEGSEHQAKLSVSGFLPETTHKPSNEALRRGERSTNQPEADPERNSHGSVALSSLLSDLSSMVNNPQLSDVQLQVDSGEVYFAHSFMVYARCPLLAEMVHESGIGVKEADMPRAQRVLLSDVPGQAVFALLQFLYTACCSIPTPLQPHILELASRFDLQELEQFCHLQQEKANDVGDEALDMNQEENANNQTDQAFMELLQSMWNEEDEDTTDSDGGGQMEEAQRPDEVTSGDGELPEEQVNEEELEEIYEFAATQKKKKEQDREEEEEDEEMNEEPSGDAVFTILTELREGLGDKPDPDLDCNNSRLFSESWEGDNSSLTSKPGSAKTQSRHQSPQKPSKQSSRTLFQSSESLADELSVSPPLVTSNLPVTGLSPGQSSDQEDGGAEAERSVNSGVSAKQQVPHSVCISPPDSPPKQKEPELIVLSDSSEEMEVNAAVLKPHGLLVNSSSTQNLQSYTEIKSRQEPTPSETKEPSNMESVPYDPLDCSPEISWLIPSTPQSDRSTRSSSTQTRSSLCRTQLFPNVESSPPSSSVFSSPALAFNNKRHTSSKPPDASACATESSVSRLESNGSPLSSSDRKAYHQTSCAVRKTTENSAVDSSQLPRFPSLTRQRSFSAFSKQETPSQLQHPPCSSTPLQSALPQPIPPSASPLHTDKQNSPGQRRERAPSGNMETELGSLHRSPSDPPSSSSHSECQPSKKQSKSSSLSRRSAESSSGDNTRDSLQKSKDCMNDEADAGEISFQQSFMDEPPIAFNDSWGLDANAETNPGRFSLRLDDSEDSNLQRSSSKQQEATVSSSSISCPTPDDRVQSSAKRGGAPASPPLQCHIPQRSKNMPSSPPEPTTRTTPECHNGALDSKLWDSWVEGEEGESLPLSQRVTARLRTPVLLQNKKRRSVMPITPMPHYSDMDTPELKNKLSRFGVRPLPKRQMVLKLKEIHQYTHQLASSDSEDEAPQKKPPSSRLVSCTQMAAFKEPKAPAVENDEGEEGEMLSASQGSNTSSTAASEESERSNPELVLSSDGDSDSDGGISSSQAASRLRDHLKAVRFFILSDSSLYNQILQYQPLVLSQFQAQLKAAGIRLGAAKLMDYLDSQCITFTTAKQGHSAPSKGRRGRKTSKGPRAASGKNKVVKL